MICRSRSIHLYSGFRRHTLSRSRAGACRAISESHHAIMWRESGDRFVAVERRHCESNVGTRGIRVAVELTV